MSIYSQNLTFSFLNLYAKDNAEDVAPYSVLYKGLSEADSAKNNGRVVISNVSETAALELREGSVIKVYWNWILTVVDDRSLNWAPKEGWKIEHFNNNRNSRYWKLIANSRVTINPKSELTFEVSGIKASSASTVSSPPPLSSESTVDTASLTFELFLPDETEAATKYSSVVALKRLDHSQDSAALPISVNFIKPRNPHAPYEWNVSQSQAQLFHPTKQVNQVYSNTITALIESRLGFSIRNPSRSPLVRKSAKADPRFVVSVSYGDNVRALGRMQDGLAEDRLLLDGTSEADDTETIPLSSSRNSLKGQSSDGIELFDDGIDNNNQPVLDTSGMAFTQTVSDSAGIKTWTLRPPKDQNIVLNSQQTLRWVFNGICPDDNIGDAMVTIAYYDISGYKDGYLIIDPQKVRPRPFLIAPSKPAEVVFKSPNAGIKPSWQFFGVDQISIRHQHGNKEIHRIADLPAIATYTINGKDRKLWQDHQLVAEMDAGDGGTISCLIANVKCEVPFSLDMRNKVYRSDWFQLQKRPRMIKEIQECKFWRDPQGRKLFRLNREARRMREGEYCRFSVWYEGEDWILSLEIWDPHFQTPSEYEATIPAEFPTMPPRLERMLVRLGRNEPRVGGGFFPLEEISYPGHEGVATFKVKINHQATKDGKTSQLFATSIEGRCWISSGDLIFDDSFFKKLTFNPGCGATPFDDYCLFASEPYPSATPLPAGVERPQPLPNYNGTESKHNDFDVYDTKQNAVSVSLQIYGGYDGSPTGTLSLMPGYDSQRPQSHVLGSRSFEPQDFHDQILQAHDFHEADLDQANFDQADLQGANLRRASLREASLQGAKLVMVNGSRASLRESNLEAALLNYANFEQATFEAANLSGASFLGANLTEAIFSGANLTEANFDGAIVEGAVFDTGCGLSAEQLEALRQRGAKVLDCPEPRYTPDDLDPASDPEAIP